MERILTSAWFLASTAACCGLAAAFTTWLASDSSPGVRLLAALSGLAAGLIVMLLFAWAAADEGEAPAAAAPAAAPPEQPVEAVPVSRLGDAHGLLRLRLEEGRALHEELEPAAVDPRVGSWIEDVRKTVEHARPGLVGYLDQLTHRPYADDRVRLDAHLRRLGTIVRDAI